MNAVVHTFLTFLVPMAGSYGTVRLLFWLDAR